VDAVRTKGIEVDAVRTRANSRLAESEGFPYGRFCDSVSMI